MQYRWRSSTSATDVLRRLFADADRLLRRWLETPQQRARLAILALLVTCAGNVYLARDVARLWRPDKWGKWEPEPYAARLAAVRERLPADARLGYVNLVYSDIASLKHDLFATRFALFPLCVVPGTDAPYLLIQGAPGTPIAAGGRTVLLDDPAQGFALLQSATPP